MKKILKKFCNRKLILLNLFLVITAYTHLALAQNIDLATGMTEVKGQLDTLYNNLFGIASILCGIGAIIGLVISIYKMFTDEHGNGWKVALAWFGILAFVAIALYVIKVIFNS